MANLNFNYFNPLEKKRNTGSSVDVNVDQKVAKKAPDASAITNELLFAKSNLLSSTQKANIFEGNLNSQEFLTNNTFISFNNQIAKLESLTETLNTVNSIISQSQTKITALQNQIFKSDATLNSLKETYDVKLADLNQKKAAKSNLMNQKINHFNQIALFDQKISSINTQIASIDNQINLARNPVEQLIPVLDENGEPVIGEDGKPLMQRVLPEVDNNLIAQLEAQKEQLEAEKVELGKQKSDFMSTAKKSNYDSQIAALNAEINQMQAEIGAIKASIDAELQTKYSLSLEKLAMEAKLQENVTAKSLLEAQIDSTEKAKESKYNSYIVEQDKADKMNAEYLKLLGVKTDDEQKVQQVQAKLNQQINIFSTYDEKEEKKDNHLMA